MASADEYNLQSLPTWLRPGHSNQTAYLKNKKANGSYSVLMIPERHRPPRVATYNPQNGSLINNETGLKWTAYVEQLNKQQFEKEKTIPTSLPSSSFKPKSNLLVMSKNILSFLDMFSRRVVSFPSDIANKYLENMQSNRNDFYKLASDPRMAAAVETKPNKIVTIYGILFHRLDIRENPTFIISRFNDYQKELTNKYLIKCNLIFLDLIQKRNESQISIETIKSMARINELLKKYSLYFTKHHSILSSRLGDNFHVSRRRTVNRFSGANEFNIESRNISNIMSEFLTKFWDIYSTNYETRYFKSYAFACLVILFISPFLTLKKLHPDVPFLRNQVSFLPSTEGRITSKLQSFLNPREDNLIKTTYSNFQIFQGLIKEDLVDNKNTVSANTSSHFSGGYKKFKKNIKKTIKKRKNKSSKKSRKRQSKKVLNKRKQDKKD